jgi:hypothetical protein
MRIKKPLESGLQRLMKKIQVCSTVNMSGDASGKDPAGMDNYLPPAGGGAGWFGIGVCTTGTG